MIMIAAALAVLPQNLVEFQGDRPGNILPATTPVLGVTLDPKVVCAVIESDIARGMDLQFSGTPRSTALKHYVHYFPSTKKDKTLIALPFALDEKYREVTLKIRDKEYAMRLPVSKSFGLSQKSPVTSKAGSFTVTAAFAPLRYSDSDLQATLRVERANACPRIIAYYGEPRPHSGTSKANEFGQGNVRMLEGKVTADYLAMRTESPTALAVSVLELEAVPIKLKVKRNAGRPTEYFLTNGQKVYSSNHRVVKESGFEVVKVRNIYLSNYGIRNRPPGNATSYGLLKDGEVFDAVGYRRKGNVLRTSLKLHSLPPLDPAFRFATSGIYFTPRGRP